ARSPPARGSTLPPCSSSREDGLLTSRAPVWHPPLEVIHHPQAPLPLDLPRTRPARLHRLPLHYRQLGRQGGHHHRGPYSLSTHSRGQVPSLLLHAPLHARQ